MSDVRLIDANEVITIQVFDEMTEEYTMQTMTVAEMIDRWADEGCPPTIDAVPVVRCRECKHHRNGACPMRSFHVAAYGYAIKDNTTDDGFCHMGAKMDGGAD